MSTLAVIVIAVVIVLLLAMLVAGARKAARTRPGDEEVRPYRSHADASRRGDAEGL